jgi:hypothetical protein
MRWTRFLATLPMRLSTHWTWLLWALPAGMLKEKLSGGLLKPAPGESEDSSREAFGVYSYLRRDLDAFGRQNGLIVEARPGEEPFAAVREVIQQERLALKLLRNQTNTHWQSVIDSVLDVWRDRLPEKPPPEVATVRTWHQTQAALDRLQRQLDRLQGAQEQPGKWADPARFAADRLKGNERKLVEMVIGGNGRVPIATIAKEVGWEKPWDDAFNGTMGRVNKKLKSAKLPYRIFRQSNEAHIA